MDSISREKPLYFPRYAAKGSFNCSGTTKAQANQTENTEDLLYSEVTYHEESDKFSFEMPADDIDLSVSMDQAENGIMLLAN